MSTRVCEVGIMRGKSSSSDISFVEEEEEEEEGFNGV